MSAAFSRSLMGGKKTADLKFRTTDEVEFEVARRASSLGMTKSEWLERGVLVLLYGLEHVHSMEATRTDAVAAMVSTPATNEEQA